MSWILNDSAPTTLAQGFATPAVAKSWGWFGMPASGEGSLFDAAATPWAYDFSVMPSLYMWTAESPPGGLPAALLAMANAPSGRVSLMVVE